MYAALLAFAIRSLFWMDMVVLVGLKQNMDTAQSLVLLFILDIRTQEDVFGLTIPLTAQEDLVFLSYKARFCPVLSRKHNARGDFKNTDSQLSFVVTMTFYW